MNYSHVILNIYIKIVNQTVPKIKEYAFKPPEVSFRDVLAAELEFKVCILLFVCFIPRAHCLKSVKPYNLLSFKLAY